MKMGAWHKQAIVLIAILIFLALLHLYIQNKSISLKYEYAKLKESFQELYDQNRYNHSLLSRRSSLDRIEKIAKNDLGMIFPEKMNYIIVTAEAEQ